MANRSEMIAAVVTFTETHGRLPALASVGVGTQTEHGTLISLLRAHCMDVGVRFLHVELPIHTTEVECVARVCELNQDPDIQGISVLLPLPTQIDERKAIAEISIEKNVDGVHPSSDESASVGIISCGPAFEPYQSHFERELSDEPSKRARDLRNWKWYEVVDLESNVDEDLLDTADLASTITSRVK